MSESRTVEVFTAGCPLCVDVVELVQDLACDSCDLQTVRLHDEAGQRRAEEVGVQSVPAVAVNGTLASCCEGRGGAGGVPPGRWHRRTAVDGTQAPRTLFLSLQYDMCPRTQNVLAVLSVLVFLVPVPAAQAQSGEKGKAVTAPDATVYVDGLACPFCAYGLEKKLKKLKALRTMEVQLEKGRVLLAFKEGQTLSKEQIEQAVTKAGFTARKIEFADEGAPTGASS
jgi:copper chaperone CopZ